MGDAADWDIESKQIKMFLDHWNEEEGIVNAYEEGREAHSNGVKKTDNPYEEETDEFEDWADGWEDEEDEALDRGSEEWYTEDRDFDDY